MLKKIFVGVLMCGGLLIAAERAHTSIPHKCPKDAVAHSCHRTNDGKSGKQNDVPPPECMDDWACFLACLMDPIISG